MSKEPKKDKRKFKRSQEGKVVSQTIYNINGHKVLATNYAKAIIAYNSYLK